MTRILSGDVFLPDPKLGEEHTRLRCPHCDTGEISIDTVDVHRCDACDTVFALELTAIEGDHPHPVEDTRERVSSDPFPDAPPETSDTADASDTDGSST